ncbi:DUF2569 family protein [Escherichia coli]|nr:DUF2569 family protein [Escherichia coli]
MIDTTLPLTDIHRHLDGNIRPQTILELGRQYNISLPAQSLETLIPHVQVIANEPFQTLGGQALTTQILWGVSFITAIAMWYYTLWLTIAFFKRRRCVPKHYIIWLLISVLLAVKAFAFSPVEDGIAVRQLLFTLLATALIVPYFKRSSRVKATFVNP